MGLPLILGGISLGKGIYDMYKAEQDKKALQKEIDDYERQELVNPYKNVSISTLKADQMTDANLSNMATSVDALQRGGTRAVLGGLPKLNEQSISLQNLISQDLENQDLKRQYSIAQGEERIRQIREERDAQNLLGLGQGLQVARQDSQSAFNNIISSGLSIDSALNTDKTWGSSLFSFYNPNQQLQLGGNTLLTKGFYNG